MTWENCAIGAIFALVAGALLCQAAKAVIFIYIVIKFLRWL